MAAGPILISFLYAGALCRKSKQDPTFHPQIYKLTDLAGGWTGRRHLDTRRKGTSVGL